MKKLLLSVLCIAAVSAIAQTRTPRYDDLSRGARLTGVPSTAEDSNSSASGATTLPYALASGNYYNDATFPLMLNVLNYGRSNVSCAVNGTTVMSQTISDGGSHPAGTCVIPGKSSFGVNGSSTVTALANGATWRQTGILFAVSTPSYSGSTTNSQARVYNCVAYGYDYENPIPQYNSYDSSCLPYPVGSYYAYASSSQIVTVTTCNWTASVLDNWGRYTPNGSGSIPAWPAVPCDNNYITQYQTQSGIFAPPPPPPVDNSGNN